MNGKTLYGRGLTLLSEIAGLDAAKTFDARLRFHKKLDLRRPATLAEKITWIELHEPSPLASRCADKFAVRAYVAERGLGDILVPLAGGPWSDPDEIDIAALPDRFVFKAIHGCRMNWFVEDKTRNDWAACFRALRRWMGTRYGTWSLEPHYGAIPPRFLAEAWLGPPGGLTDYKFHCLNGRPAFVLTTGQRGPRGVVCDLYDPDWTALPGLRAARGVIPGGGDVPRPRRLTELLETAAVLSAGHRFVRVDLYDTADGVRFGEMTFTPATGVLPYFTEEFDRRMGQALTL